MKAQNGLKTALQLIVAVAVLTGAASSCDRIDDIIKDTPKTGDAGAGSQGCARDADCRVFSDYCTGCNCRGLGAKESDPVCSGPGVQCFADPCLNKVATCQAGTCVLASATPGNCGSATCTAGEVCCNRSCGICTPPGGACTQQFCN